MTTCYSNNPEDYYSPTAGPEQQSAFVSCQAMQLARMFALGAVIIGLIFVIVIVKARRSATAKNQTDGWLATTSPWILTLICSLLVSGISYGGYSLGHVIGASSATRRYVGFSKRWEAQKSAYNNDYPKFVEKLQKDRENTARMTQANATSSIAMREWLSV